MLVAWRHQVIIWTNHASVNYFQWGLVAITWGQFHRKCSRYLKISNWRLLLHLPEGNELKKDTGDQFTYWFRSMVGGGNLSKLFLSGTYRHTIRITRPYKIWNLWLDSYTETEQKYFTFLTNFPWQKCPLGSDLFAGVNLPNHQISMLIYKNYWNFRKMSWYHFADNIFYMILEWKIMKMSLFD